MSQHMRRHLLLFIIVLPTANHEQRTATGKTEVKIKRPGWPLGKNCHKASENGSIVKKRAYRQI